MLADMLRFNRRCKACWPAPASTACSLGEFLDRERLGQPFRDHYLLPMAAAIWSCPTRTMMDFPAESLARFFDNHGLLSVVERPLWRTVVGGSHSLREAHPRRPRPDRVLMDGAVGVSGDRRSAAVRLASGNTLAASIGRARLSCRPGPGAARAAQRRRGRLLGRFRYQPNRTFLHTDRALMPGGAGSGPPGTTSPATAAAVPTASSAVSVTYWMNRSRASTAARLPGLAEPAAAARTRTQVIAEMTYDHPVFDQARHGRPARAAPAAGADRSGSAAATSATASTRTP
jgi:predicted NAD/FAD-binding protein